MYTSGSLSVVLTSEDKGEASPDLSPFLIAALKRRATQNRALRGAEAPLCHGALQRCVGPGCRSSLKPDSRGRLSPRKVAVSVACGNLVNRQKLHGRG